MTMKRKKLLLALLAALIVLIGGGVVAYYLITQSNTPTSINTPDNTKPDPKRTLKVENAPKKPENAEATATGVLKQIDSKYVLHVENAPNDLQLDLSKYKGDVRKFIGKKVVIKIAETTTADNDQKTITLVVDSISVNN